MDSHMAGQLYVKGIWVNDFSKEGLHAGADMTSLRLDRDRRAIVHRSEIEHQVSDVIYGGGGGGGVDLNFFFFFCAGEFDVGEGHRSETAMGQSILSAVIGGVNLMYLCM